MNAITVSAHGLDFHADSQGEEPRALDIHVAERLGFARPRKIRDLIKRLVSDGFLNDIDCRPTVGRTLVPASGGYSEHTEYLLTERAALIIGARSDTPGAPALLRALVDAYLAARKLLAPPPPVTVEMPSTLRPGLASCVTVGERTTWRNELFERLGYAAYRRGCSWNKAHGELRKHLGVVSYLRIPASLLDEARAFVTTLAQTPALPPAPKSGTQLISARQLRLWSVS